MWTIFFLYEHRLYQDGEKKMLASVMITWKSQKGGNVIASPDNPQIKRQSKITDFCGSSEDYDHCSIAKIEIGIHICIYQLVEI